SLQAALSLKPSDWFKDNELAKLKAFNAATEEDEGEAIALIEQGKTKLENGSRRSAERIFKKVIKKYPTTIAAGESLYLRGKIKMANGQWIKAFDLMQIIIEEHPEYPKFDQVIAAQFECATVIMEGARSRLFGIIPTFKQEAESILQFERILRNAPYGDYAPLALMNIALVAQKQNQTDISIDALDRLINFYPQSTLAPDAYFNLAETFADLVESYEHDQGATRKSISYYEDFIALFPQSDNIGVVEARLTEMENSLALSRLHLGDFYYRYRNNNTAALVFYNEAITIAPQSDAAAEATLRIDRIEKGISPAKGARLLRKLLFAN
ncbi:MAG: outer membrane protein assembly factor BamD, partial [Verrucomicrobiota bacterium]|nr:outer membrane protein assembly factor BamD [Verrucomicrobiota bacterium]